MIGSLWQQRPNSQGLFAPRPLGGYGNCLFTWQDAPVYGTRRAAREALRMAKRMPHCETWSRACVHPVTVSVLPH